MRYCIALLLSALSLFTSGGSMAAAPPQQVAKTVTFIFLADEKGALRPHPQTGAPLANGTGFFVLVENKHGPGGYGYLVTARHVLQDQNGIFFKRVFIRINDKAGGSAFGPIDLYSSGAGQNIFVHTDPTVDVAVIPLLPDLEKFDVLMVPAGEMIKTRDEFKASTIAPGSDVFFAGLFTPHVGDKVNVPIFRFGRVAMLTDERIRWNEVGKPPQLVQLYLLETMSFGGNSGSPVFFSQGMDRQPGSIILGDPLITLAGVMRGNFNEAQAGEIIQLPNAAAAVVRQNIGIAAVTPAYLLREILFSDALTKLRESNPIVVPKGPPESKPVPHSK